VAPLQVDGSTLFQIGSTTKTFTATAVMRLIDEGRLDLEAPVRAYVPELRLKDEEAASRVLLIHLLNHTAGWSGDLYDDTGDGADALARYVRRMRQLDQQFPPGAQPAAYNNAAVGLAGRIVEKVTGMPFDRALRALVLDPLGLQNTLFSANEIMTRKFAVGHVERNGRAVAVSRWRPFRAADPMGGLSSTVDDQLEWARFHMGDGTGPDGKRLLARKTIELMRQPSARAPVALGDWVGVSWFLRDVDGVRLVGHGGTTEGQQSAFQMLPGRGFATVINTNSILGGRLNRELMAWILRTFLGVEDREPPVARLSNEELGELAGTYAMETAVVSVSEEGGNLVLRQSPSASARRRLRREGMPVPPDPRPMTIRVLEGGIFTIVEGPSSGSRGEFIRTDGVVTALNIGSRLGFRRPAG